MYSGGNCGFCVVCKDLEDDVQEWSTCDFEYNQFNKEIKHFRRNEKAIDNNSFWCRLPFRHCCSSV